MNNQKNVKFTKSILMLLTTLLLSGCFGDGEKSTLTIIDKNRIPASTGAQLYQQKCSSCHGPLESSDKIGKTFTQIKQSIGSIPEMSGPSLTALSDEDLQYIADALDRDPPTEPPQTLKAKQVLGGRKYIISKFKELFAGSGETAGEIQVIAIIDELKNQPGFMGGKATHYEFYTSTTPAGKQADADALVHPLASVPRRGLITKTCQEVLSIDDAVMNVLVSATINQPTSPPSELNMQKLFNTMNPTTPINSTVSSKLIALHQEAELNKGLQPIEAWRFVIYTLCISPTFEMY